MSARTKRTSCHELITLSARRKVLKPAAASSRSGTSADLLLSLCIRQTVTSPTVLNTSNTYNGAVNVQIQDKVVQLPVKKLNSPGNYECAPDL